MIPIFEGVTWASAGAAIGNHLWQSTLVVVVAWVLTRILKKNGANVRHGIWLAGSLKFLVPFSLFVSLGGYLHLQRAPASMQSNLSVIESFSQTLVAPASLPIAGTTLVPAEAVHSSQLPWFLLATWFAGFGGVALYQYHRWRRFRALINEAQFLNAGREVEALRRIQLKRGCPASIYVGSSASAIEPGVRGIFTHLLLLPSDISGRLDDTQLEAVVAHEVSHVERRDNLFAAIHMLIEMLFWFHPLIWWVGSQLVDERERACDEHVLESGSDPEAYAGAILKVCQYYLASPLTYVSGISGSNLRTRIEDIMTSRTGQKLDFFRKLLIAVTAVLVVAAPIAAGLINVTLEAQSQSARKLAFDAASVKVNKSGDRIYGTQYLPGGRFVAKNIPIGFVIAEVYDTPPMRMSPGSEFQKAGDPKRFAAVMSERYDIEGVAEKGAIPAGASAKARNEKLHLMTQSLLAERFKLAVHHEKKDGPVYVLVVANKGPKLQKAAVQEEECAPRATNPFDPESCHVLSGGQGQGLHGKAADMSDLASALSNFSDRPVIDKTGLAGLYNIQTVGWVDMRNLTRPPRPAPETEAQRAEDLAAADPSRPTVFAVLDGLGLKLEQQTAPIETLFIDHIEPPSEN